MKLTRLCLAILVIAMLGCGTERSVRQARTPSHDAMSESLAGDAEVSGDQQVSGAAEVSDDEDVSGEEEVSGDEQVSGDGDISGDEEVSGDEEAASDEEAVSDEEVGVPSDDEEERKRQAVLEEVNFARTDPKGYAEIIRAWIPQYDGQYLRRPGRPRLITVEGAAAAREAVEYLMTAPWRAPLRLSEGMSHGAHDHVLDQSVSGKVGHEGRTGEQVWDRVSRYGIWEGSVGENISYGFDDPREVVASLLVDDGVPDRGHRQNLFDPDFRILGVAFGPHPQYGAMCVLTFATRFRERTARVYR